jgi:hypothetical protein
MDPKLLAILFPFTNANTISLAGDLPGERMLREGEGGDPGGGGGDKPATPKTFTQDELNGFLAKERRKFADYDDVKAKAGKVDELVKQVAELNEKLELAGKSEGEKTKLLAERMEKQKALELAALMKSNEEARATAARAVEAHLETKIRFGITHILTEAKALPEGLSYAVDAFRRETKIEFDDATGKFSSIEVDGIPFADPKKAAEAWLKVRPMFQAAPVGGGGTRGSNGAGVGRSFDQMSPAELAELGLNALHQR